MEFTRNFRVFWWAVLVACLSYFVLRRSSSLSDGAGSAVDIFLLLVWLAVCLGPLFAEIQLPGLRLKQKIDEVRHEVARQIADVRNDVRNALDVRASSSVANQFTFGGAVPPNPPPDERLDQIAAQIHAMSEALSARDSPGDMGGRHAVFEASLREKDLFAVRKNIEVAVRNLSKPYIEERLDGRKLSFNRMLEALLRNGIMDPEMAQLVRAVYSTSSLAIHGEELSEKQIAFVLDTAPEIMAALENVAEYSYLSPRSLFGNPVATSSGIISRAGGSDGHQTG